MTTTIMLITVLLQILMAIQIISKDKERHVDSNNLHNTHNHDCDYGDHGSNDEK